MKEAKTDNVSEASSVVENDDSDLAYLNNFMKSGGSLTDLTSEQPQSRSVPNYDAIVPNEHRNSIGSPVKKSNSFKIYSKDGKARLKEYGKGKGRRHTTSCVGFDRPLLNGSVGGKKNLSKKALGVLGVNETQVSYS